MDLPPDFSDLLAEFEREGVEYVIVGGYAVAFHARPRSTKDIDLLVRGSEENLRRVSNALARFGAPKNVVASIATLGPTEIAYFGQPPLRIDVLRTIDGVDTDAVISRAAIADWGGRAVRVIALDDLIANKRAANREQDRIDVRLLERTRSRRK